MASAGLCEARVSLGVTMSKAYFERIEPGLAATIGTKSFAIGVHTNGTRSRTFYHSAFFVAIYSMWQPGKFLWGEVDAGFGVGGYLTKRGFRDGVDEPLEENSDANGGFAVKVDWSLAGPIFIGAEAFVGINRATTILVLADNAYLTVGVKF